MSPEDQQALDAGPPPGDFRGIPIVPTTEEILAKDEVYLRTNKISGAYTDAGHYLDVQFRLLREDFVRPLRMGVSEFLKNPNDFLVHGRQPPGGSVRLYRKVRYMAADNQNLAAPMQFIQLLPELYETIDCEDSKRLMTGSLVVLTDNEFRTAYFATVRRGLEKDGELVRLGITWEGPAPQFDDKAEFLMLECDVYFEAYRHTLQVLKEMDLHSFPMAKFIVGASTETRPPAYFLRPSLSGKLRSKEIQLLDDYYFKIHRAIWPSAEKMGLDENQYDAFKACLTNEFAIVQGPPGTGKTFLGLKLVEVLLRNDKLWSKPEYAKSGSKKGGPIVVVCYTNHALDQFLEGVLDVFKKRLKRPPSMVRIGGGSSPSLDEFHLSRIRHAEQKKYPNTVWRKAKSKAFAMSKEADRERRNAFNTLAALSKAEGVVIIDNLAVRKELREEVPQWILNKIETPSWFGLDDVKIERPREDEQIADILKKWFKPREPPPDASVHHNHAKVSEVSEFNGVCNFESEFVDSVNVQSVTANYAPAPCTLLFDREKTNLARTLSGIPADSENTAAADRAESRQRRIDIEKKKEDIFLKEQLCKKVVSAYNSGTIEMVDVARFFDRYCIAPPDRYLSTAAKWSIYFHVLERAKVIAEIRVREALIKVADAQKQKKEAYLMEDCSIISHQLVVGMTTTGAAKYNILLKAVEPKIVIVEEAAKVLEPHIVASLTPTCEHLILIGDHQQLRPNTAVYELAKKYNFEISLFERMVNNNLNCHTLRLQHRMRPEISNLLIGTIYSELQNAQSVLDYPDIEGMTSNLFFINHIMEEDRPMDSNSKINPHEAKFLTALCRYLLQNGYEPDKITILATYTAQVTLIEYYMRQDSLCEDVRVTSVDNFQGEENEIILLSLVRSNDDEIIGFMKEDNRICVAISRAKHGLYIMGNMDQLAKRSEVWQKIQEKLYEGNHIGERLEIKCQIHGKVSLVCHPDEFYQFAPLGGCQDECGAVLECSHVCNEPCHVLDRNHKDDFQCKVEVVQQLPCGHMSVRKCSQSGATAKCKVQVLKKIPCGHVAALPCWVNPDQLQYEIRDQSPEEVEERINWDVNNYADEISIFCGEGKFYIRDVRENSDCGYGSASDEDKGISVVTQFEEELEQLRRRKEKKIVKFEPKKHCGKLCSKGLHPCNADHHCQEACPPCSQSVKKSLACGHELDGPCISGSNSMSYEHRCTKPLSCKHVCEGICGEPCGPCKVMIPVKCACSHRQKVKCCERNSSGVPKNCNRCLVAMTENGFNSDVDSLCMKLSFVHFDGDNMTEDGRVVDEKDVEEVARAIFETPVDAALVMLKRELLRHLLVEFDPTASSKYICKQVGAACLEVVKVLGSFLWYTSSNGAKSSEKLAYNVNTIISKLQEWPPRSEGSLQLKLALEELLQLIPREVIESTSTAVPDALRGAINGIPNQFVSTHASSNGNDSTCRGGKVENQDVIKTQRTQFKLKFRGARSFLEPGRIPPFARSWQA